MSKKIANVEWSDVEVAGFSWSIDGRDFVVKTRRPSDTFEVALTFRWAEALEMNLRFSEGRGGRPLSWAVKISRRLDGKTDVVFDFANDGFLRLICEDAESTKIL